MIGLQIAWYQSSRYLLFFREQYQLLGVRNAHPTKQSNIYVAMNDVDIQNAYQPNGVLYTHIPSTNIKFVSEIRVRAFLRSKIANMRNKSTHRAANSARQTLLMNENVWATAFASFKHFTLQTDARPFLHSFDSLRYYHSSCYFRNDE